MIQGTPPGAGAMGGLLVLDETPEELRAMMDGGTSLTRLSVVCRSALAACTFFVKTMEEQLYFEEVN